MPSFPCAHACDDDIASSRSDASSKASIVAIVCSISSRIAARTVAAICSSRSRHLTHFRLLTVLLPGIVERSDHSWDLDAFVALRMTFGSSKRKLDSLAPAIRRVFLERAAVLLSHREPCRTMPAHPEQRQFQV
jgi:hypothetical protein